MKITKNAEALASELEKKISDMHREVENLVEPHRQGFIRRFPGLFAIVVAFGVATTFYGFERVVAGIPFMNENPLLILVIGLGVLYLSGRAYKKLY